MSVGDYMNSLNVLVEPSLLTQLYQLRGWKKSFERYCIDVRRKSS